MLAAALLAWAGMAFWQTHKPLPEGLHVEGPAVTAAAGDVEFIADITSADAYGRAILSQAIFDEVLALVRSSRGFLVLDYFLLNGQRGADVQGTPARALSGELRDALLERRRTDPQLPVLLLVDPINELYGGAPSPDLALLRAAGVEVVTVDLDALRDSNYLYSSAWRLLFRWWEGVGAGSEGWLPNPLDEGADEVTLRAWARLINFKADHRKVILGEDETGALVGIVGSANPHDASSAHSNVALKVRGAALEPLLASELAIARWSGWRGQLSHQAEPAPGAPPADSTWVQTLTERAIHDQLVSRFAATARGDAIDIAMFYISDRDIVDALLAAAQRGVAVRLILFPNKDAFGRTKLGIPNRQVVSELISASDGAIHVRWYRTHGEQFHTKLAVVHGGGRTWLTLGSANFTRRNLEDFNLEANVAVEMPHEAAMAEQVREYFETLWANRAPLGIEYTADYGFYADPASSRYWLYRMMESTGLSTF